MGHAYPTWLPGCAATVSTQPSHRGRPLRVYLLFEHKSLPEHWTLLQLLRYLERPTALEILEALLRYYVQGTGRLDERDIRQLLQATPGGEQIMQAFIDRYIDQGLQQGLQQGEAAILLRQMERRFGPLEEPIRRRVAETDPETLLRWSERVLTADTLEAVFH